MPRVLVVDDDLDVREVLAEVLADTGYEVLCARHGLEALDVLREAQARGRLPHVILLDLNMPVMDGLEFRARQRADETLSDIRVIAMSSDWEARADADAKLRKPLNFAQVLAAIDALC